MRDGGAYKTQVDADPAPSSFIATASISTLAMPPLLTFETFWEDNAIFTARRTYTSRCKASAFFKLSCRKGRHILNPMKPKPSNLKNLCMLACRCVGYRGCKCCYVSFLQGLLPFSLSRFHRLYSWCQYHRSFGSARLRARCV